MTATGPVTLSRALVEDNRALLDRACAVRFVRDVRAGRLPAAVFAGYLSIERHFVVESARLLAAAALRAPGEETMIGHLDAAHHLVHEQLDYFAATFDRLGGRPPVPAEVLHVAGALAAVARRAVADGRYWPLIVLSYATEHLYATWCAAALPDVDTGTEIGAWVELHTRPQFAARVRELAADVDTAVPAVDVAAAHELYRAAITAEITFHDAPYLMEETDE